MHEPEVEAEYVSPQNGALTWNKEQ
jgi:hypothetical protein